MFPIDLEFCMCSFLTLILSWYVSSHKILIGSQFPTNRQLTLVLYVVVLGVSYVSFSIILSLGNENKTQVCN
jgi:hypothetical protein